MKSETFTDYTVFLISNEGWKQMMLSKHHYAEELSKNNTVFFVNPSPPWTFRNLFNRKITVHKAHENLFVVDYCNLLPQAIFKRFFIRLNDKIAGKKILRLCNNNKKCIFWQFDPFRFLEYPQRSESLKRIYHVVDPYYHIRGDKNLAQNADLIIVVNTIFSALYEKYNKPLLYIPHGFHKTEIKPNPDFKNSFPKPYILMAGNVAEDIDFDCLENIAKNNPALNLLIIGKNKLCEAETKSRFSILLQNKNVLYHEAMPMEDIEQIALDAQAGLITYKKPVNKIHVRTPLKSILYILAKTRIITNYELAKELKDLSYFIGKPDYKIGLLKPDETLLEEYKMHIINNTYEKHIQKIFNFMLNSDK